MDTPRFRLRKFRPEDYPGEARLAAQVHPERPESVDELRHWDELLSKAPFVQVKVVAEHEGTGEMVGLGALNSSPWSYDPRSFWTGVLVDRDLRGRGIGRALAAALEEEASRRNAARLWTSVRADDSRSLEFMARRGCVERRRLWQSRLEVREAAPLPDRSEALRREGIIMTTLAEEGLDNPEVRRRVHDLGVAAGADVPRLGSYSPPTLEQFQEWEFAAPGFLPDAYFLARRGEQYVGVSNLTQLSAEPRGLDQSFTGVRREWRGHGVAIALKRLGLEYARHHGYQFIQTTNDSLNAPMWAINERIGYRREIVWVQGERETTAATAPPPDGT
jgi:mycothiol synthase